jgi:hypothetical protein
MSFGLSVESLDQRILIDESHPAVFFKGKYTTTNTYGLKTVTITDCNTMPIVFAKNLGSGYKISTPQITYNGGTSWTIGVFAGNDSSDGYYSGAVDLYVFDILGQSDNVNYGYGMNVYNESGQAIFTTNKKPLKISGYHTTTQVFNSAVNEFNFSIQTVTNGAIPETCAISCSAIGTSLVSRGGIGRFFTHGVRRYSSSSLKFGIVGFLGQGPNPSGAENRLSGNQHIMFVDYTLYD